MSDVIAISRRLDEIELLLERLRKPDVGGVPRAFTPTYVGTTPGVTTYTTQEGFYTIANGIVVARATIIWTGATGSGSIRLGGLPFVATYDVAFPVWTQNVTFANGSVQGVLQAGNAVAQLFSPATNAAGTELTVEVAGTIRYCIVYLA